MTQTFSEFNKDTTVTNQGVFKLTGSIPHFESLHPDKILAVVHDIIHNHDDITITEKLDGNNLIVGYDNLGKFYTSREAKGDQRYYSIHEYDNTAANACFIHAHDALQSHPTLKHAIGNGFQIECEIMYGRQPNAIVYGENHIAVLRALPGDKQEMPPASIMENLDEHVGWKFNSQCNEFITEDGKAVNTTIKNTPWNISKTSHINPNDFDLKKLHETSVKLSRYLMEANKELNIMTNRDILNVKLNTIPHEGRPQMKKLRESVNMRIDWYKKEFKDCFLKTMRQYKPSLRTVEVCESEDIGIEGMVIMDKSTNEQFKIVDKDVFTALNKFNFSVRNNIKATSHVGRKSESMLNYDGDVFGNMLQSMAEDHGQSELGDYLKITKYLKSHKGDTLWETVENAYSGLNQCDFADHIFDYMGDLDQLRKHYLREYQNITTELPSGKTVSYTDAVHQRTLMYFADVTMELANMYVDCRAATNQKEQFAAVFAKQLKSIHSVP
jgi:hypothetical protein